MDPVKDLGDLEPIEKVRIRGEIYVVTQMHWSFDSMQLTLVTEFEWNKRYGPRG